MGVGWSKSKNKGRERGKRKREGQEKREISEGTGYDMEKVQFSQFQETLKDSNVSIAIILKSSVI